MNKFNKLSLILLGLGLGLLAKATPARAAESCHAVQASAVGQNHGDLTTDATISDGGLLQGTAHTEFTPTGMDGTYFYFTGTVAITAKKATLVVAIEGSFNMSTGGFVARSTGMTGTGRLAGASGALELNGVQDGGGRFTESLTGTICVDLAK